MYKPHLQFLTQNLSKKVRLIHESLRYLFLVGSFKQGVWLSFLRFSTKLKIWTKLKTTGPLTLNIKYIATPVPYSTVHMYGACFNNYTLISFSLALSSFHSPPPLTKAVMSEKTWLALDSDFAYIRSIQTFLTFPSSKMITINHTHKQPDLYLNSPTQLYITKKILESANYKMNNKYYLHNKIWNTRWRE